jgi:AcrR family transcriptional regulator
MSGTARREQLLDVGRTLFAEKGFEATSIEEIASRAGVSKPVVYEHFGGKENLYAVVVDREMSVLLKRITSALTAGRPRELVEQAALALLTYIEDEADGFRVLTRDAPVVSDTGRSRRF